VFEFAWFRSDVVLRRHLDHSPCSTSRLQWLLSCAVNWPR
jgi:hypothetical protein